MLQKETQFLRNVYHRVIGKVYNMIAQKPLQLFIIVLVIINISSCSHIKGTCTVPKTLHNKIIEKYSNYEIVTLKHLIEEDRLTFQKEHSTDCPGLVKLNFWGNGKPTFAILLINSLISKPKYQLIIATNYGEDKWELKTVDNADTTVSPVIWSESSGEYRDVWQENKIIAKYPVILFVNLISVL